MRALALLALASAAASAPQPVMFAGPTLGGGVPVEVHGAPHWRLDRAFQRTCVTITCSGSKARVQASRLQATRHLVLTLLIAAQKYEAFEGLSREDVVTRMAESTLGGCAPRPREAAARGCARLAPNELTPVFPCGAGTAAASASRRSAPRTSRCGPRPAASGPLRRAALRRQATIARRTCALASQTRSPRWQPPARCSSSARGR
jgi:hypothetical protein